MTEKENLHNSVQYYTVVHCVCVKVAVYIYMVMPHSNINSLVNIIVAYLNLFTPS